MRLKLSTVAVALGLAVTAFAGSANALPAASGASGLAAAQNDALFTEAAMSRRQMMMNKRHRMMMEKNHRMMMKRNNSRMMMRNRNRMM